MPKLLRLRPLTDEETQEISRLAHARTEPARAVERAQIVWRAQQGVHVPQIARALGRSEATVRLWITRFNAQGLDGLEDRGRPARRKHRDLPGRDGTGACQKPSWTEADPGRCERRARQEADSGRRGTGDGFGAFAPATGMAFTATCPGRTIVTWVAFLEAVDTWIVDEANRVYAILDNLSTHRAGDVLLWSLTHPRWEFVFQPTYAASLNRIEPW